MNSLLSLLEQRRPILLDGAMGTELQRRGVKTKLPLWSAEAILHSPALIKDIHLDYINAGAQIITTNTFRTNTRAIAHAKISKSARELTFQACGLAQQARTQSGSKCFIAGSLAPVEDCYRPDLVPPSAQLEIEHAAMVKNLCDAGVDFIFIETMNCIREAEIAMRLAAKSGMKVAISFVAGKDGNLLSGESLEKALLVIEPYNPIFVCLNCAPLSLVEAELRILAGHSAIPFGVYANGIGEPHDELGWQFSDVGTACETYANHCSQWLEIGATVIGGCCGTTPEYIEALRPLLASQK